MKQKLAFARSLLNDPTIIFLDEPSSGLDPQATRNIEATILSLKKEGKTVIITSHILPEVEKICDNIAILKDGSLLASGKIEDIKNKYLKPAISIRIGGDHSTIKKPGIYS